MQISLFAEETQIERLSKLGDSLERLKIIDFESFRPTLSSCLKKECKSRAGRPPFDSVMMFKVLVLRSICRQCLRGKETAGNPEFTAGLNTFSDL